MTRALENMGYKDINDFTEAVKDYMVETMADYDLYRVPGKSGGKKRLRVDQYKQLRKEQDEFKREKKFFEQQQQEFQREKIVFAAERQVMLDEVAREKEKAAALAAAASDALRDASDQVAACRGWQEQQQRQAEIDRRMQGLRRDFAAFRDVQKVQQKDDFF